jgi:hypothetical protein
MAQTVPVPVHETAWRRLLEALHLRPRPRDEAVGFADVVWAHHEWIRERNRGEPSASVEARYRKRRAAFEAAHGPIYDAYWCLSEASGVALTIKPPSLLGRLVGVPSTVRLHRVTDWVTGGTPRVADLLHRCDTLAIRINEVLRGTSERIAIQWVYSCESHLLGHIERSQSEDSRERETHLIQEEDHELNQIERYYQRAGRQAGRIVYFWGMMIGLAVLVAVAAAVGAALAGAGRDLDDPQLQNLFASYVAGAIGAVVSVLSRMSSPEATGRFSIDYEVGRNTIRRLASFRPMLGAVFGVAVYFALLGGQISFSGQTGDNSFYYFAIIAFLSGFSERWTRVILGTAEASRPEGGAERAKTP